MTTPRDRRDLPRIGAIALAVALAAAPEMARADGMAEREAAAQALYDSATALMDARDYASACPKLEEVTNLVPEGLGARLTLAECYEGAGKLASAWTQYAIVAPRAARAGQQVRREKAEAKMAELGARVAKLTIVVDPSLTRLEGLEIARDGVTVGRAQWGEAVPIDGGEHLITARAPGKQPWSRPVTIEDGGAVSVALDRLVDAPAPKPAKPREAAPAPPLLPDKPARPWQAPLGFAVGGLGLASAGVGFVFGGLAVGKQSDASNECDRNLVCTARGLSLRRDGRTLGNASTGLLVVGGVLAATGVVLIATAPSSKPRAHADRASASLSIGLGTLSIAGEL
jgi:hypothetical protein